MESSNRLFLVNLYDGEVQNSFDDMDQLVAYLRRKDKSGNVMDETAFAIFWGRHISTASIWKSAFPNKEEANETVRP